jgi:hypothetical protein
LEASAEALVIAVQDIAPDMADLETAEVSALAEAPLVFEAVEDIAEDIAVVSGVVAVEDMAASEALAVDTLVAALEAVWEASEPFEAEVEDKVEDMAVAVALAVAEPFVAASADWVFALLKDLYYRYINPSGGYSPSLGAPQGNCSPVAGS